MFQPCPIPRSLRVFHSEEEGSEGSEEDEGDEAESEDEGKVELRKSGDKNSQLTVGHKNDRTFVVRGDKIGVFKHTGNGKVEYAATIKDLGFKKMKSFKPKRVSLFALHTSKESHKSVR